MRKGRITAAHFFFLCDGLNPSSLFLERLLVLVGELSERINLTFVMSLTSRDIVCFLSRLRCDHV